MTLICLGELGTSLEPVTRARCWRHGWTSNRCCKIKAASSRATSRRKSDVELLGWFQLWQIEEILQEVEATSVNPTSCSGITWYHGTFWLSGHPRRPLNRRGSRTTGAGFKLALPVSKPKRNEFVPTVVPWRTNIFPFQAFNILLSRS